MVSLPKGGGMAYCNSLVSPREFALLLKKRFSKWGAYLLVLDL